MFVRLCLKFVDVCSSSSAIRQTQRKCTLMDNSCGVQFWVFLNFQMEILPLVVNNKKLIFSPTSWKPVSLEMFPCRMLEKKGWGYFILSWSSDVIPTIRPEVFVIHKHGVNQWCVCGSLVIMLLICTLSGFSLRKTFWVPDGNRTRNLLIAGETL